jgi:hypothetical protein
MALRDGGAAKPESTVAWTQNQGAESVAVSQLELGTFVVQGLQAQTVDLA